MYPIQIGFVWTFRRKFAKYPGPPPSQNTKKSFHKQNPEKKIQTPMKSMYPIQIGLFWTNRRKFAKYPGHPLQKYKKSIS